MTITDNDAREVQLAQLRRRAVNDATRRLASDGIELTHEEADDLGEEVLDWMRIRLDMRIETTDTGVVCRPNE